MQTQTALVTGRILEILASSTDAATPAIVVLEIFHVSSEQDAMFGMPSLTWQFGETKIMVIPAQVHSILVRKIILLILLSEYTVPV
jgi:hypothetical protein